MQRVLNIVTGELVAKQLELLHELVPGAARVAVLINPTAPNADRILRDVEPAARAIGLQIQVLNASTSHEIDAAFATFVRERPDALFVVPDAYFASRRVQLANLASRHAIPAAYATREIAEVGGLMSHGSNIQDAWRQAGIYTGRILKGAKPADLPVVQSSKFELVINASTARMLGLTVRADARRLRGHRGCARQARQATTVSRRARERPFIPPRIGMAARRLLPVERA